MDPLSALVLEAQEPLVQRLAGLNQQCDRISELMRQQNMSDESLCLIQLEKLLNKRQVTPVTSLSTTPEKLPVEIREIRFVDNDEYLATLVNQTKVTYHSLTVRTNSNLELGVVEILRAADELKVLLYIPLPTFMQAKSLSIFVVSSAATLSAEFLYSMCEISEPELTDTSLTIKVQKNIKCALQGILCIEVDQQCESLCELQLTELMQVSRFECHGIPHGAIVQVRHKQAVISNSLQL